MTGRERLGIAVAVLALALMAGLLVAGCQETAAPQVSPATLVSGATGYGLIHQDQWTVSVTGAAGSGEGSSAGPVGGVEGHVFAVYLDYTSGVSTTTHVTLTVGTPTQGLVTKADSATDGWYYPGVQLTGADGAVISGAYEPVPASGSLLAEVGGSSTGTLTVTVLWGQ